MYEFTQLDEQSRLQFTSYINGIKTCLPFAS